MPHGGFRLEEGDPFRPGRWLIAPLQKVVGRTWWPGSGAATAKGATLQSNKYGSAHLAIDNLARLASSASRYGRNSRFSVTEMR